MLINENLTLHEKCPNTEFFLVRIFRKIRTRKISVFGQFSRSVNWIEKLSERTEFCIRYMHAWFTYIRIQQLFYRMRLWITESFDCCAISQSSSIFNDRLFTVRWTNCRLLTIGVLFGLSKFSKDRVSKKKIVGNEHCVSSVRIRSFCGSYFPALGLNTEI